MRARSLGRYWETAQAKEFADELNSDIGIPISELIQSLIEKLLAPSTYRDIVGIIEDKR
jgi:hypothetical protein